MMENEGIIKEMTDKAMMMKLRERKCTQCKMMFLPMNNNIGTCRYHTGKIKFYSCKGCGSDQYYNCCDRCLTCNPGCKQS